MYERPLNEWVSERIYEWKNEWNNWTIEQVNEWKSERVNEWTTEDVNNIVPKKEGTNEQITSELTKTNEF